MAVPITAPAMPQPRWPAFAALVGTVRLAATATTARPAAIFDLMFMARSPLGSLADRNGPHGDWSEPGGKGSAPGRRAMRAVRKVTADWKSADKRRAGRTRPFATKPAAVDLLCPHHCAVILGCGAPCPVAEAAGDCTARIA